ncbi:IS66 family insertion sequence element accessory protein TnpB [Phaeobacter sp. JH18-32]|uniref:IS66 family insertion sequence element accessory protein TnpB n=1 Tax=Phaeobacter TaxID=302485 RepID=UPI003A8AAE47
MVDVLSADTAGKNGRKKRFWSDEEEVSICTPGGSVAQVVRLYAMNTNLIHNWLRDAKFAPDLQGVEDQAAPSPCFLPVEIVDRPVAEEPPTLTSNGTPGDSMIEIDIAGGHQLRIDPKALARLIRGVCA